MFWDMHTITENNFSECFQELEKMLEMVAQ